MNQGKTAPESFLKGTLINKKRLKKKNKCLLKSLRIICTVAEMLMEKVLV